MSLLKSFCTQADEIALTPHSAIATTTLAILPCAFARLLGRVEAINFVRSIDRER
jgi:hypothetical protein